MAIQKRLATGRGKFTPQYPELLQLLYSLIMVSYPVNIFRQPRIPDSGSAFFDTTAEPAV